MVKPRAIHHQGQDPQFTIQFHKVWKNSLSGQIGEAIAISEEDPTILMNSRSEWGSNPIPRVTPAPADQLSPPPGDSSNKSPLQANANSTVNASVSAQSPSQLPRKRRRGDAILQHNHELPTRGPLDGYLQRPPVPRHGVDVSVRCERGPSGDML